MLKNHLYVAEQRACTTPANMQRTGLQVSDAVNFSVRPEDLEPVGVGCTRKTPKTLSRPRSVKDSFITSSSLINAVVGGRPTISESDTLHNVYESVSFFIPTHSLNVCLSNGLE